jgi:hypothetical protein
MLKLTDITLEDVAYKVILVGISAMMLGLSIVCCIILYRYALFLLHT